MKDQDETNFTEMYLVTPQIYKKIIDSIPHKSDRDFIESYNKKESDSSISDDKQQQPQQLNNSASNEITEMSTSLEHNNADEAKKLDNDDCGMILQKLKHIEEMVTNKLSTKVEDDHIHDRRKTFVKTIDLHSPNLQKQTSDSQTSENLMQKDDPTVATSSIKSLDNSSEAPKIKRLKWICEYCGKIFASKWNRQRHINTIHHKNVKSAETNTKAKKTSNETSNNEIETKPMTSQVSRKRKQSSNDSSEDEIERKKIKLFLKRKEAFGSQKRSKFPKWTSQIK